MRITVNSENFTRVLFLWNFADAVCILSLSDFWISFQIRQNWLLCHFGKIESRKVQFRFTWVLSTYCKQVSTDSPTTRFAKIKGSKCRTERRKLHTRLTEMQQILAHCQSSYTDKLWAKAIKYAGKLKLPNPRDNFEPYLSQPLPLLGDILQLRQNILTWSHPLTFESPPWSYRSWPSIAPALPFTAPATPRWYIAAKTEYIDLISSSDIWITSMEL